MTLRLDQLTSAVEVGRFYLVPTVEGEWYGQHGVWPVIGPQHNDAQCLQFGDQHYHLDIRFMTIPKPPRESPDDRWGLSWRVIGGPMSSNAKVNPNGFGAIVFRRRKCRRLVNPSVPHVLRFIAHDKRWGCHFAQWVGKQARHDGRGWVCPHRKVPLADHPVDGEGVITCPLHLLRIDAATGIVLPQKTMLSTDDRRLTTNAEVP